MNNTEVEIEILGNEIQQKSIIIARMNAKIFAQNNKISKLQKQLKSTKDTRNAKGNGNQK